MSRIVIDPKIRFGKPTVRGTRITVEEIVRAFSNDLTAEDILKEWPTLGAEDLPAALAFAADALRSNSVAAE